MSTSFTEKMAWRRPEVIAINLEEYVCMIDANARSGGCAGCGCGCSSWQVSCTLIA